MSLQVTEKVTLLPAVGPSQNGENVIHCARSVFDSLGRLLWQKSPRGFITSTHYDVATNVLHRRIEDVDVAAYNNEPGGGQIILPCPRAGKLRRVAGSTLKPCSRTTAWAAW